MSDSVNPAQRRRRRFWIVVAAFVVLGAVFFHVGQRLFEDNRWLRAPFEIQPYDRHIDEYAWYHYTYHYHLFFHEGALDHLVWGHDVPAIGQPNTYKFVLGWLFDRHNIPVNTSEAAMKSWWQPMTDDAVFKVFLEENLAFPDEALMVGRFYSAVFAYLAIVVCVVYLSRLTSLLVAVAGGVFIAGLELFGVTRMMSDSLLLLAFLLCFLLYDFIEDCRWRVLRIPLILVYSVVVGLTMGIKLTGFLALTFLPGLFLLRCLKERSREVCRDGALWSLVHGGVALSVFVALHPQIYGNPIAGIFRFFGHQAPVTFAGDSTLLGRAKRELLFQIGELADTLGSLVFMKGLFGLWFFVIVLLLALGGVGLVVGKDRAISASRVLPLIITVCVFLLALSHELDERYTWLVTIVLSFFVVFGLDFLVYCARILVQEPVPDEGGE